MGRKSYRLYLTARVATDFRIDFVKPIDPGEKKMASVRRLTAMLAADVAGYARLMGADEEGTHERLKAHLGELVNPKIKERRGRTVKNTGDGFLAEFVSVVDAVRCAVEIQRGMIDREAKLPKEQRIWFRIGVNLGDVIVEEHDIFGDGVNVAARLEALAEPGGICVSQVARDQVRDKLDFTFEDLGEQHVKNIARPVRVYRVRDPAIPVGQRSPAPPRPLPLPGKPSHDYPTEEVTFAFGSFRLVPAQRLLLEDGKPLRLGSRALDILVTLVESAGEILPKDQLIARTWPDTVVDEGALRVHIAALRRALGEGRAGKRYITNIPGRGYSFVAPVTREHARPETTSQNGAAESNNLPAPLMRVIGRDDVITALGSQLTRRRFLTIVGPGGIGKTTVAIAVADAVRASYRDGVRFVGLASLADPDLVPSALGAVLGVYPSAANPLAGLAAWLRDKAALIVLDKRDQKL